MSTPSSKQHHHYNDENKTPANLKLHHDAPRSSSKLNHLSSTAHTPARHRQPLAPFDNIYSRYNTSTPSKGTPVTPASRMRSSGTPKDATPVRPVVTKVDPDARELPLPKGLVFARPAASLLPLPTPPQHRHASPRHGSPFHHPHHSHSMPPPMMAHHSPLPHHIHSTPSARSVMTYASSPMTHMPSTPDMHASPYPPGPIELHDLLAPARFPGPLPQAYLNQGEMPSNGGGNDDNAANDESSANARRTLVSCNPWDYRPEDHGKNKPRRRFSPGELDMLEILWSISHNPHKWQRQKLARWFGCTTRHLTVWFQNRRQDLKKAETLVQMAETNPDTASRALAAVQRANRGDAFKFTPEQQQVMMDIVSDRLLPEMWFAQQASGSSPTPKRSPSPMGATHMLPAERRLYNQGGPMAIAPKPRQEPYAIKPLRRGFSLDDVCTDREQSMSYKPLARPRPRVDEYEFDQMHKNDPRYREALINMLPSELSSDAVEAPEDAEDEESAVDEDSPTRKRARHNPKPRPTLPSIGLGRPAGAGHKPRSSFGRASSSDVLACSSRARFLANNGISSNNGPQPPRAVTDPVPSRATSAGPTAGGVPPVPEHPTRAAEPTAAEVQKMRKLSRQGSWSHLPSLKHRDSFDRSCAEATITEASSPVPEATRSPTPPEPVSPRTAASVEGSRKTSSSSAVEASTPPSTSENAVADNKPRLPIPEGRNIYSFSTELEPETKRGAQEMDENVLTGAHALMELFRGR